MDQLYIEKVCRGGITIVCYNWSIPVIRPWSFLTNNISQDIEIASTSLKQPINGVGEWQILSRNFFLNRFHSIKYFVWKFGLSPKSFLVTRWWKKSSKPWIFVLPSRNHRLMTESFQCFKQNVGIMIVNFGLKS